MSLKQGYYPTLRDKRVVTKQMLLMFCLNRSQMYYVIDTCNQQKQKPVRQEETNQNTKLKVKYFCNYNSNSC